MYNNSVDFICLFVRIGVALHMMSRKQEIVEAIKWLENNKLPNDYRETLIVELGMSKQEAQEVKIALKTVMNIVDRLIRRLHDINELH